jgi:hypothetical protein
VSFDSEYVVNVDGIGTLRILGSGSYSGLERNTNLSSLYIRIMLEVLPEK